MTTDVLELLAAPSRWQRFKDSHLFHSFSRDKVAMVSFSIFMLYVLASLLAPLVAPFDPYDPAMIDIMDSEIPPSWQEMGFSLESFQSVSFSMVSTA